MVVFTLAAKIAVLGISLVISGLFSYRVIFKYLDNSGSLQGFNITAKEEDLEAIELLDLEQYFSKIPQPFNFTDFEEKEKMRKAHNLPTEKEIHELYHNIIIPFTHSLETFARDKQKISDLISVVRIEDEKLNVCKEEALQLFNSKRQSEPEEIKGLRQELAGLENKLSDMTKNDDDYFTYYKKDKEYKNLEKQLNQLEISLNSDISLKKQEILREQETLEQMADDCDRNLDTYREKRNNAKKRMASIQEEKIQAKKAQEEQESLKQEGSEVVVLNYDEYIEERVQKAKLANQVFQEMNSKVVMCNSAQQQIRFVKDRLKHIDSERQDDILLKEKTEQDMKIIKEELKDLEGKQMLTRKNLSELNKQINEIVNQIKSLEKQHHDNQFNAELQQKLKNCLDLRNKIFHKMQELQNIPGLSEKFAQQFEAIKQFQNKISL